MQEAEVQFLREQNELQVKRAKDLSNIEVRQIVILYCLINIHYYTLLYCIIIVLYFIIIIIIIIIGV